MFLSRRSSFLDRHIACCITTLGALLVNALSSPVKRHLNRANLSDEKIVGLLKKKIIDFQPKKEM